MKAIAITPTLTKHERLSTLSLLRNEREFIRILLREAIDMGNLELTEKHAASLASVRREILLLEEGLI